MRPYPVSTSIGSQYKQHHLRRTAIVDQNMKDHPKRIAEHDEITFKNRDGARLLGKKNYSRRTMAEY